MAARRDAPHCGEGRLVADGHRSIGATRQARAHGDDTFTLRPEPLAANHLPAPASGSDAITLTSITDVVGVNQLAAKQTLPFAASGMTIVYGSNGAGKSGYARILKKICRARFPGQIMPDAFSDATPRPARCGERALPARRRHATTRHLMDALSDGPHPVLSAVSVFDRESAFVHLRDENEVAYRPFGLDIPDELASACTAVKDALNRERRRSKRRARRSSQSRRGTPAHASWSVMTALKADVDLTQLRALAVLTETEQQRHAQLTADLARDPIVAAAEHRLNADVVRQFVAIIERAAENHSDRRAGRLCPIGSRST